MIFGITALLLTFVAFSEGHQRRFLFGPQGGTSLESALPDECVYLSEFEDVLSIANRWIQTGEYLYSELLRIRIRELEHISLDDVENGYRYLLQQWKDDKSTEFHEAIVSIEYTSQYQHSICLRMLEYLLNTFLRQHQGNVCAQYLRLPSKDLGPNLVKCSPVQTAIPATPSPVTANSVTSPTTTSTTTTSPTTTTTPTTPTTTKQTTIAPTTMPSSTTKPTQSTPTTTTTAPATTPTTTTTTTTTTLTTTPTTSTTLPTTIASTTVASTLTTQQTTTKNPNIPCAVCNNGDCKNNSTDLLYCPHPDQYCLVRILDESDSRSVTRRCVDKAFCEQDFRNNGGYKSFCFMADDGTFGFPYECNFCCVTAGCNIGPKLIPVQSTLFNPN